VGVFYRNELLAVRDRVQITQIYEGTNQVQRVVMAKKLLAGQV